MGCALETGAGRIRLTGRRLSGIEAEMGSMPDAVLTLAALAPFAEGPTRIAGIGNLRAKESDRIHAAAAELARLGVDVEQGEDSLTIQPAARLAPGRIETHGDHRVAMSFALLGLDVDGIAIADPGCVSKSFPGFWEELERFRAHHSSR
jgi:3-phosphoshikimate 1-carboxyvinyltransferase